MNTAHEAGGIVALRRNLAHAEQILREKADREARSLMEAEQAAWSEAQAACFSFDRIRQGAKARLDAIRAGDRECFPNERQFAEMALRVADQADANYTVISFAPLRDRLRYLRGGSERESVVRVTLERGGVYTEACGGRHFQDIVR